MKYIPMALVAFTLGTGCDKKLEQANPNQQTSATFWQNDGDAIKGVNAAYGSLLIDGTYMRFTPAMMDIRGDDIKSNSCSIGMGWETTWVSFAVTADVESKVMAQIKNTMEGDNRPYFNAALYYIDNGKDLNKAVEWLDKAYAQNPEAFWVLYQKARAQKMLGKKTDALATSNKSIDLAKKAKNDDYVALNEKLQKEMK